MTKIKELFWVSIGLLKLSFIIFPEIYSASLEALELFISKGQDGLMKLEDFGDDSIALKFPGILKTVMPSLFSGPVYIQQRSFNVLIMSWMALQDKLTDPHKTGIFYTHIYTCLWIIARCANLKATYVVGKREEIVDVLSIIKKFKNLLTNYKSDALGKVKTFLLGKDFNSVAEILDSIIESVERKVSIPVTDDRMDKLLSGVYRLHLPDHICNLTDFLVAAFTFDAEFRPAVVQMIVSLWKFSRKIENSKKIRLTLESLIQKLPFLCFEREFEALLPPIFSTASHAVTKDVDLTSRESAPIFPSAMEPHGSIQEAGDWLKLLEIQSSNKFFVWS